MNAETVLVRIDAILVDEFELEPGVLSDAARIREDLDLDSLDAMDLIALLEKEFGVRLDEKQLLKLRTVGEMRSYVVDLVESAPAQAAS